MLLNTALYALTNVQTELPAPTGRLCLSVGGLCLGQLCDPCGGMFSAPVTSWLKPLGAVLSIPCKFHEAGNHCWGGSRGGLHLTPKLQGTLHTHLIHK